MPYSPYQQISPRRSINLSKANVKEKVWLQALKGRSEVSLLSTWLPFNNLMDSSKSRKPICDCIIIEPNGEIKSCCSWSSHFVVNTCDTWISDLCMVLVKAQGTMIGRYMRSTGSISGRNFMNAIIWEMDWNTVVLFRPIVRAMKLHVRSFVHSLVTIPS